MLKSKLNYFQKMPENKFVYTKNFTKTLRKFPKNPMVKATHWKDTGLTLIYWNPVNTI